MCNSKLIVLVVIAVGAVFGIGTVEAADFPARTSTEAPASVTLYNWTGCYLGGYVGGARQSRQVNAWDPTSTGGAFPAGTFYNPAANNLAADRVDVGEFNYDFRPAVIGGGTVGCN
jgi:outer membrane immunogenic protein